MYHFTIFNFITILLFFILLPFYYYHITTGISINFAIMITGLPQLGYPEVEPIILDELHIALGGGPDGYRAQFKEVTARGVSSLRVTGLRARLSDDEVQLQLALSIPKIRAAAKYRSSGTLIDPRQSYGSWRLLG